MVYNGLNFNPLSLQNFTNFSLLIRSFSPNVTKNFALLLIAMAICKASAGSRLWSILFNENFEKFGF